MWQSKVTSSVHETLPHAEYPAVANQIALCCATCCCTLMPYSVTVSWASLHHTVPCLDVLHPTELLLPPGLPSAGIQHSSAMYSGFLSGWLIQLRPKHMLVSTGLPSVQLGMAMV